MKTNKLTYDYQKKWSRKNIYDRNILSSIGTRVQLHKEIDNVLSSAAACLNVFGALNKNPNELRDFLNQFGLDIQEIIKFPSGCNIDGEEYDDEGYVLFKWIGPKKSTINEIGGKRGVEGNHNSPLKLN